MPKFRTSFRLVALVLTIAAFLGIAITTQASPGKFAFIDQVRDFFGTTAATPSQSRIAPIGEIKNTADTFAPAPQPVLSPLANFTAGDLAVLVAAASANNTTGSVIEINTTTAGQSAIQTIAISGTGANALRFSGSQTSTMYLATTNDGSLLSFVAANSTDTATNTTALTTKGIGTLDSAGTFNLATTFTNASGATVRSASSLNNTTWYAGDSGGLYTNGAAAASPSGNFRSVKPFGGVMYGMTASTTSPPVGTFSAATGGTFTALPGLANGNANKQDFYLVSSAGNTTYDILYTLEATSATAGTISKYSLVSGTWTANGTYVTVNSASTGVGGFGLAAAKSGSGAVLYITTGTGATTANTVLKITDTAGFNTNIAVTSANNVTLYTAGAGTIAKGIAFTPATPASPPTNITTNAATNKTGTTATLNGSANPNGAATTGYFRYATVSPGTCNDSFGTRAPLTVGTGTALGSGSSDVAFFENITGLSPNTTYFFCAIASNSGGTTLGNLAQFTTPAAPTVTTSVASLVTQTTATLNGTANPNNSATTGWFRYDTTNPVTCDDVFGTRAPASGGSSLGAGSSAQPFSQPITGLAAATTYWVCAIASNAEGNGFGTPVSFTTQAPPAPTVTTSAATNKTATTATLNGTGNPNGDAATGYFRYATVSPGTCNDTFGTRAPVTVGTGTALGSGASPVAFFENITGLTSGTTYFFCAIASNAGGPGFGQVQQFTTPTAPTVTTNTPTNIGSTTATFNGTANPNNAAATGWFRYFGADPGTCTDSVGPRVPTNAANDSSLGSGSSGVPYSQPATGLIPGTDYWVCAFANNVVGTSAGSPVKFTTQDPNYTVTTSAGVMTVQHRVPTNTTLGITQPSAGNIRFTESGGTETFSVNGAVMTTGNSGDVPLAGITSIVINGQAGNETFNVATFSGNMPSLTMNGGPGNDTTNFTGTYAMTGSSAALVQMSRAVTFTSPAAMTSVNGNITIEANLQASPTVDTFHGIDVNGATINATGSGIVTLNGKGGVGSPGTSYGIYIHGGATVKGGSTVGVTTTDIIARGTTASTAQSSLHGIDVDASTISSNGGNVHVQGFGGIGSNGSNYGVIPINGGTITSGNNGNVLVEGTGGTGGASPGVIPHQGAGLITSNGSGTVTVIGTGGSGGGPGIQTFRAGKITSGGAGLVTVTGTATNGIGVFLDCLDTCPNGVNSGSTGGIIITGTGSTGIQMDGGAVIGVGTNGPVTLIADTMNLSGTITAGPNTVTIKGKSVSKDIDLGGSDSGTQLGLTDAELDAVSSTSTLAIGEASLNGGFTNVSGIITQTKTTNLVSPFAATVLSGGNLGIFGTISGTLTVQNGGVVSPGSSPGIINAASVTLNPTSTFNAELGGTTPGNGAGNHDQINSTGGFTCAGTLNVAFVGGFTPTSGDTFTIGTGSSASGSFVAVNWPAGYTGTATCSGTTVVLSGITATDLTTSVAGPASAVVSTNYDYTLTVNNGAAAVTGVKETFNLPSGVAYVNATGTNGFSCSQASNVVTCTGGSINANSSATITVTVTAPASPGSVTSGPNAATVDPDNTIGESNDANNTSTQTVVTSITPPPPPPYTDGPNVYANTGGPHRTIGVLNEDFDVVKPQHAENSPVDPIVIDPRIDIANADEDRPRTAALTDDSFVMVWTQSTGNRNIYAQKFRPNGDPLGTPLAITPSDATVESQPDVTGIPGGGYAVIWVQDVGGGTSDLKVAVFGNPLSGTPTANLTLANAGTVAEINPTINFLGGVSNSILATWDVAAASTTIYGQRFNAAGTLLDAGPVALVPTADNFHANNNPTPHAVAGHGDGSFAMTWVEGGNVKVQRFDGALVGSGISTLDKGAIIDRTPDIAILSDGRYIVAWEANTSGPSNPSEIWGQRFDATGNFDGAAFELTGGAIFADTETEPSITGLPDGGFAMAWLMNSTYGSNNFDVNFWGFDADGTPRGAIVADSGTGFLNTRRTFTDNESGPGPEISERALVATSLIDGRVLTSWIDPHTTRTTKDDILYQVWDMGTGVPLTAFNTDTSITLPTNFARFDTNESLDLITVQGLSDAGHTLAVGHLNGNCDNPGPFTGCDWVIDRNSGGAEAALLNAMMADPTTNHVVINLSGPNPPPFSIRVIARTSEVGATPATRDSLPRAIDIVFVAAPTAPTVTTNAATNVAPNSATLNGTADPNGADATGYFRYYVSDPGMTCTDSGGTRVPGSSGTLITTGSGVTPFTAGVTGLTAGTQYWYCAFASNSVGTGAGSPPVTFTTPAVDYTVTTGGNAIVVTDVTGHSDSLTMFENSPGQLNFQTAATRYFSINGAAATASNSGNVPLAGAQSITINEAVGDDIFTASGTFTSMLPSLTVNGGVGNDTTNLASAITFLTNANLDVDMQNDDAAPGADNFVSSGGVLALSGTGNATVRVSRLVDIGAGAGISVVNGNMVIEANQQGTPTAGNFIGVSVNGGSLTTSGTGTISIKGKGGADAATGSHTGINLTANASINSTNSGTITLDGQGATGNAFNLGVGLANNSSVNSITGDISITGVAGAGTSTDNIGIQLISAGSVKSTGSAKVTLMGTGAVSTARGTGIRMSDPGTIITSSGGNISLTGNSTAMTTGGANNGVTLTAGASVTATGGTASVTINGTGGGGTDLNIGVALNSASTAVTSSAGDINIIGIGGSGTGLGAIGINISSGPQVTTTNAANIVLSGTGGSAASDNYGVGIEGGTVNGTSVNANGTGSVSITGTGGSVAGTDADGVRFEDSAGPPNPVGVTTASGSLTITGTAGNADATSSGIQIVDDTTMTIGGTFSSFIADSMSIGTSNVALGFGGNTLTLRQKTNGIGIDIGGADSATALGLTDAELDTITAATINIGDANTGPITSTGLSRSVATNFVLTNGSTSAITLSTGQFNAAGGNVTFNPGTGGLKPTGTAFLFEVSGGGITKINSGRKLSIVVNGNNVNSNYDQFGVNGTVDITGAVLEITGSYMPTASDSFEIINNDGSDAVVGTFAGLAEGALVSVNGVNKKITYVGDTGNDVVLLPIAPPTPTVEFSNASYIGNESMNGIAVLTRSGDTTGSSTVHVKTTAGTATEGASCGANVDYIAVDQDFIFAANETTKNVPVFLCGDIQHETSPALETINLTVTTVTNATIGTQSTSVMNINDTASQYLSSSPEPVHQPITFSSGSIGNPYPAVIHVAGAPTVGTMRLTIYDLFVDIPDDLDLLLVGPHGQKYAIMGDVGGQTGISQTSPVTITFSDFAADVLPDSGPLVTGQFLPTTCETPVSNFPAPAPAGSYVEPGCVIARTTAKTMGGTFGGTDPNGDWQLYVRDDAGQMVPIEGLSGGAISAGWGLEFGKSTASEVTVSGRVTTASGRGITNAKVTATGGSLAQPIAVTTGRNGAYTIIGLTAGETYVITVGSQRFTFATPSRVVSLSDSAVGVDFTASP